MNAWFELGRLANKTSKFDTNEHIMLFSLERALLILNSPKSTTAFYKSINDGMLTSSTLSPLMQYTSFLQANVTNSIGVYLYEQGDFQRAGEYLNKASTCRRQMLDNIRGPVTDNAIQRNDKPKLFKSDVGGLTKKSKYAVSSLSDEVCQNIFLYAITYSRVLLPRKVFGVDELELSLSLSLEYSALTHHADQKYQLSLSLFQESLILRTCISGKIHLM